MSKSDINARISKFMDSKRAMMDLSLINEPKSRRSHRPNIDVSSTPFIALAIK
jgi:hypothetical protein